MKLKTLFLIPAMLLCGCSGVTWPQIGTDVVTALTDVQKAASAAQASGAVPSGKIGDVVNDTSTVSNALETLASGAPVTQAQADAAAASFHSNGKTTQYIEIGTQVINGFVQLTKAYLAAHQPAPAVQAAQVQFLVNAAPAVQAGLTTP